MAGLCSSERQTLEKAIQFITQAVQHEKLRSPPHQALRHYCRGLHLLLPLLASPRCTGHFRDVLRRKCCFYLNKSRQLHKFCWNDRYDDTNTDDEVTTSQNVTVSSITNDVTSPGKFVQTRDDAAECHVGDDIVTPEQHARIRDDVGTDVSYDVMKSTTGQGVAREDNVNDTGDAASNTRANPSTQTPLPKKKKRPRTRQVYCEVATVEVPITDAEEEEEEAALKEAEEVDALARQFFSEEELQGLREDHEQEQDEHSQRQLMVQQVLDAIVCSDSGSGLNDSWVGAAGVGLSDLQIALRERLVLPLTFPKIFSTITSRFNPYLLLYGHHGDGILPLLRHLHKIWASYQFHVVSGQSLLDAVSSGTVTETDLVKGLFERAFQSAPCALCVMDLEVFGRTSHSEQRDVSLRLLKTEMLVHMESLHRHQDIVIFLGVTSQPWLLDPFVRRKFAFRGYCPSPSPVERLAVLMTALGDVPNTLDHRDLRHIAEKTSLFTRADMLILLDEAQAVLKQRVQEARYFKPIFSTTRSTEDKHRADSINRASPSFRDAGADDGQQEESDQEAGESGLVKEEFGQVTDVSCQEMEGNCRETEELAVETEQEKKEVEQLAHEKCAGLTTTTTTAETITTPATATTEAVAKPDNSRETVLDREQHGQTCSASSNVCTEQDVDACDQISNRRPSPTELCDAVGATADVGSTPDVCVMYTPCESSDDDAIAMTWHDVDADRLQEPDMIYCDVLTAIHNVVGHVDEDDVRRLRAFHEDFGSV